MGERKEWEKEMRGRKKRGKKEISESKRRES